MPIPPLFGVCELLVALLVHPFWKDKAKLESDLLRATLKLTEPGDFVFDRRGETVFRQRCFYPIIEIEIAGIKNRFVDRRSGDRGPFRAGIFFSDASRGSGDSPAGDGHLGGLRDGADRTGVCGACAGAKRRFIRLAESFSAGRGAIGKGVQRGELLATIADEETSRQLKQARTDLQAAVDRAALPLPSSELLKAAEDNLQRLEKVVSSGNVPAVEYQKSKSEVNRLRGAVETERIERDRNLKSLEETAKKLEAEMKNAEVRSPIDGILTNVQTIDGELVSDGNELFTVSSRKNYVRGEVNEEDVGEVKPGMKAKVQLYAYRTRTFTGPRHVNPTRSRSNHSALYRCAGDGKSARQHDGRNDRRDEHHYRRARKCAARADARAACRSSAGGKWGNCAATNRQRWISHTGFFRGASDLTDGDHVIVSDQDKFHSGQPVRQRMINAPPPPKAP
jgi:hypothetical protein